MQDMRASFPYSGSRSLRPRPETVRAALSMRCSEGSDKFLLPFHGVSTKWLQHASPASCGQSRRGMLHRTARRSFPASLQKAAMYTRGVLVDMPQPFWDWWEARAEVNRGLTESFLIADYRSLSSAHIAAPYMPAWLPSVAGTILMSLQTDRQCAW